MNRRGSFLVLTTWLLAILALLALGVSFRGQMGVRMMSYDVERWQARWAAHAGLARVTALLAADATAHDALNDPWAGAPEQLHEQVLAERQGLFDVAYEIEINGRPLTVYGAQDEQSRLHLNTATAEMLARLPGMDAEAAQSLVAFRDAAEQPAEDAYYQTLQPPYHTKRAAYESLAEAALVRGMTPERFDIVSRFCTVYPSDGAPVNLNTAPREVLLALGISATVTDGLLAFRAGADGTPGTADDGVLTQPSIDPDLWPGLGPEDAAALNGLFGAGQVAVVSRAVRVRVTGRSPDRSVAVRATAVLMRPDGRIISWQED